MKKILLITIISSLAFNLLTAVVHRGYFVLKDGKVINIPPIILQNKKSFKTKLLDYDKKDIEITIKDISRILKTNKQNEAIVYLKNKKELRIVYFDNYILKDRKNPFYNNINLKEKDVISYDMINEIIFN